MSKKHNAPEGDESSGASGNADTLSMAAVGAEGILSSAIGLEIPGGCEECPTPVQTVRVLGPKLFAITVHHDEGCPFLARRQGVRR